MITDSLHRTTQPAGEAEAQVRSRSAERALRVSRLVQWSALSLLTVAAVLVFWVFDALPFQDLPAHAGLIALRHRFAGSAFDHRFFVYAPHLGPYSLFRFLGDVLDRWLGPVGAVRAIASLPVLCLPAALVWGRIRLQGDRAPTAGFLGIALSFGLMTAMGFASYLLGVAVMLFALVATLELLVAVDEHADGLVSGKTVLGRELVVTLVAPFVFVAHGHAFVLLLLLAGVSCLAAPRRRIAARIWRMRAFVPGVAIAAWVAWVERAGSVPAGSVALPTAALEPRFQGALDKLSLLVTPTLMTRSGIDLLLGVAIYGVLGTAAFYTVRMLLGRAAAAGIEPASVRRGRSASRALYLCVLVLTLLFLALPHAIGWFGFVDGRLLPVLIALCILAYRHEALPRSVARLVDGVPAYLAFGMVSVVMVASYRFQAEATGYREVIAAVPEGAHLLNLPIDGNSDVFAGHPFIHYDKLAMAEHPVVVSDLWFHQGTAVYPTANNPALRLPSTYSESDLQRLDWPAYTLSDWDYVLVRTRPDAAAPEVPGALALTMHRGGWWLYHHDIAPDSSKPL
jgi:hypothetical protein